MNQKFLTNRSTLIFYGILSIIVVPAGVINLYNFFSGAADASIGFRALVAPVLPILIYASYRSGLLVVDAGGVKVGKRYYSYGDFSFALSSKTLSLTERPLTSIWRASYPILVITSKTTAETEAADLEMSKKEIERLRASLISP
ncbi:hypothetical protein TPR58_17065 [Sphingomonas sp. HF-S3]|uniref:PH domain-containing protein n=1 Tax=Sphingomonas rustica TaxID=3103142 RepID=A0ABV0BBG4_9SPHN